MKSAEVTADSLADGFLPRHDAESRHAIRIAAPSAVVYDKARIVDMGRSPLVRVLLTLRGMRRAGAQIENLGRIPFKVLLADPGQAFVLGLIGRFWTVRGGLVDFDPPEFAGFDSPGYARAIWLFHVRDDAGATELTTITRVHCTDAASRRSFARYWSVVRPFSGLIRHEGLRLVKKDAERAQQSVRSGGS